MSFDIAIYYIIPMYFCCNMCFKLGNYFNHFKRDLFIRVPRVCDITVCCTLADRKKFVILCVSVTGDQCSLFDL